MTDIRAAIKAWKASSTKMQECFAASLRAVQNVNDEQAGQIERPQREFTNNGVLMIRVDELVDKVTQQVTEIATLREENAELRGHQLRTTKCYEDTNGEWVPCEAAEAEGNSDGN